MINLFNHTTWRPGIHCQGICDKNNAISEALRYRHPRSCYSHNFTTLSSARTYPVTTLSLNACKQRSHSSCPFQRNLLTAYPSNPARSKVYDIRIPSYGTCAVVGSGKGASGFGKDIDGHDAVIRTNDSPTDPKFKVGVKTTHRIVACWPIHGKAIPMCKTFDHPSTVWIGGYDAYRLGQRSYWKINNTNSLCQSYKGWGKCSTGLWALSFAMSVCKEIDVYGVMPTLVNATWQYSRYYHEDSYTKKDAGHNYILEKSKLYTLHCNSMITVKS